MNARPLAATLLLVAAACGDISTVSSDAASQDASGDAAPAVGTVSLELHDPFGEGGPALPGSTAWWRQSIRQQSYPAAETMLMEKQPACPAWAAATAAWAWGM